MRRRWRRCSDDTSSTPAATPTSPTTCTTTTLFFEFPQSGERFVGVENFREWRSTYPASTSFVVREVRGSDDLWVAEGSISYDEGVRNFAVSILEFREDKIARESIYVAEGWEAPESRAQWRAAP